MSMIKQFVRNPKTHVKIGIMVAFADMNRMAIGFSALHELDEGKFDKEFGEEIAIDRAQCFSDGRYPKYVPQCIQEMLPEFSERCTRYFKNYSIPHWVEILVDRIEDEGIHNEH